MNFDNTARLSAPRLPLPPALRNYVIRRFGALPSNWWELLTPKGLEYVMQYAGLSTAQAKHAKNYAVIVTRWKCKVSNATAENAREPASSPLTEKATKGVLIQEKPKI